jgi:nitric oxide reductase activation protein
VGAEIMRRYRQHARPRPTGLPLRTAGALRERAEAMAEVRHHVARQQEARARARRERQEQVARDRHLASLAKRERQAWQRVDTLIGTKRPRDYDAAVTLLADLRDMSGQKGRAGPFAQRISELRKTHATKPSLLARLKHAGF